MTHTSKNASTAELQAALSHARYNDEKRKGGPQKLESMPDRRRRRKTVADVTVPQKQKNISALIFTMRVIDVIAVMSIIGLIVWNGYIGTNNKGLIAPIAAALSGSFIFTLVLHLNRTYQFLPTDTYIQHTHKLCMSGAAALGIWVTFALIVRPTSFYPDTLAVAGVLALATLIILHMAYYLIIRSLHKKGALLPTVVMLGATESARRIIEENAKTKELNILAIFDDRIARAPLDIYGVPVVGKVEDLSNWEKLPFINRIIVTLPSVAAERKKVFVDQIRKLPNRIAFVNDEFENLNHVQQRLSEIAKISLRDVAGKQVSGHVIAIKRATDLIISSMTLILTAPILLLIAALIKLDSRGPVIFKQPRHGFNNKVFNVYKFRSMAQDKTDINAAQQVTNGDVRVTKIGRFIRKTSIDELPQLLNVLKGDMSLVGPRPHAVGMKTAGKDSLELVEEYAHRHRVKPGMTGWAQINGSRGALETGEDIARRVRFDVDYIERQNFWLDLYIIIMTLPVLLGDRHTVR